MIDETTILFIYLKRGGGGREEGFLLCFVISVSLYIHYSLFFVNSLILTDPFKCCFTLNLSNLHIFSLHSFIVFYSFKAHMFSTVVDGLYELEAWIITRRSWIFKNTHIIFRKKNQNLVQRLYGMTKFPVFSFFNDYFFITERLSQRWINTRFVHSNLQAIFSQRTCRKFLWTCFSCFWHW